MLMLKILFYVFTFLYFFCKVYAAVWHDLYGCDKHTDIRR